MSNFHENLKIKLCHSDLKSDYLAQKLRICSLTICVLPENGSNWKDKRDKRPLKTGLLLNWKSFGPLLY